MEKRGTFLGWFFPTCYILMIVVSIFEDFILQKTFPFLSPTMQMVIISLFDTAINSVVFLVWLKLTTVMQKGLEDMVVKVIPLDAKEVRIYPM